MNIKPHPVAQAVAEVLAVPRGVDHVPRGGVHLPAAGSGSDRLQTSLLGGEDELVDLAPLAVGSPTATVRVQSEQ